MHLLHLLLINKALFHYIALALNQRRMSGESTLIGHYNQLLRLALYQLWLVDCLATGHQFNHLKTEFDDVCEELLETGKVEYLRWLLQNSID